MRITGGLGSSPYNVSQRGNTVTSGNKQGAPSFGAHLDQNARWQVKPGNSEYDANISHVPDSARKSLNQILCDDAISDEVKSHLVFNLVLRPQIEHRMGGSISPNPSSAERDANWNRHIAGLRASIETDRAIRGNDPHLFAQLASLLQRF